MSLACDCTQTISIKCAFNCSRESWKAFQWQWLRPTRRMRDARKKANFSIKQMSPFSRPSKNCELYLNGGVKWEMKNCQVEWRMFTTDRRCHAHHSRTPTFPSPLPFSSHWTIRTIQIQPTGWLTDWPNVSVVLAGHPGWSFGRTAFCWPPFATNCQIVWVCGFGLGFGRFHFVQIMMIMLMRLLT